MLLTFLVDISNTILLFKAVVDGRTIFIDRPPNEPKNWRSSIFVALSHANINCSFTVDWQLFDISNGFCWFQPIFKNLSCPNHTLRRLWSFCSFCGICGIFPGLAKQGRTLKVLMLTKNSKIIPILTKCDPCLISKSDACLHLYTYWELGVLLL